jgi:putative membrane protein
MMHGFSAGGWDWTVWLILGLAVVLVIAVVVAVIFFLRSRVSASAVGSRVSRPSSPESPQEILKRRYAAGEIDRDEYQRKLRDL